MAIYRLEDLKDLGCEISFTTPDGVTHKLDDFTKHQIDELILELDPDITVSEDGRRITYHKKGTGQPKPPFDSNAWAKDILGIK